MKRMTVVFVTVLACLISVSWSFWHIDAKANASEKACKLQGTWIAESPFPLPGNPGFKLKFFATYHGVGDNEGTDVIEWINAPTEPGTSWSSARGVWVKSGPSTYKYTLMGFVVDNATRQILSISRNSGTKTLTDCNTMVVTGRVEYLDPETMELQMCVPVSATAGRITLREPCQ